MKGVNRVKIGIIGTGTISSALVRGFCTIQEPGCHLEFALSPRNREKAAALAEAFPGQVTVCDSNQQVLDVSDWVFLTVIPRLADEILSPLHFRPEQKILTIMSDHPVRRVREWTGDVTKIVRMVPLPFAAMHIGPIAIFPKDEEVEELFAPLGKVISLDREESLSVISALTAVMSAFYHLIYDTTEWGAEHGLPEEASLEYMTAFYEALSHKAALAPDGDVKALAYEMTPGGINEMTLRFLLEKDAFELWKDALDKVWVRLKGSAENSAS